MWKDGIVYLMSSKFVWGKCEIKYSQMCRLGKHPGLVQEEEFCSGMMPSLKLEIVTMRVTKVIQVMMDSAQMKVARRPHDQRRNLKLQLQEKTHLTERSSCTMSQAAGFAKHWQ
jgi:hypothetical protein